MAPVAGLTVVVPWAGAAVTVTEAGFSGAAVAVGVSLGSTPVVTAVCGAVLAVAGAVLPLSATAVTLSMVCAGATAQPAGVPVAVQLDGTGGDVPPVGSTEALFCREVPAAAGCGVTFRVTVEVAPGAMLPAK